MGPIHYGGTLRQQRQADKLTVCLGHSSHKSVGSGNVNNRRETKVQAQTAACLFATSSIETRIGGAAMRDLYRGLVQWPTFTLDIGKAPQSGDTSAVSTKGILFLTRKRSTADLEVMLFV